MSDRKNRGYQSKFAMVNKMTGEEVEGGVPVFVAGKVKWNNNGGYFVGFQEAFGVIAQDKTMTGETLSIWTTSPSSIHIKPISIGMANFRAPCNKTFLDKFRNSS